MKRTIACFMIFVLCLCVSLPGIAETTLSTIGSATVMVEPDMAVLNVGYSCQKADPVAAQDETAHMIEKIRQAALQSGVAEEDIATASLEVYPQYDYSMEQAAIIGYAVTHMLEVTVRKIDNLGETLDALLAAGVNQSYGISFASSMSEEVYLQALEMAVENASKKADRMAIASGLWLGGISSVEELETHYGMSTGSGSRMSLKAENADASIGETVKAGEIAISAHVKVVYEIR